MEIDWSLNKIKTLGLELDPEVVKAKLDDFLTQERKEKITSVLKGRSAQFAPVMEGLYDRGNVNAVMRSAEAFGFFKFHVIETNSQFKESKRVAQGADKWLEVNKWDSTSKCIQSLKADGYKVYATHLSREAKPFDALDFSEKTAVIFGNEKEGVSEEALELSDGNVLLPMSGFTQSFNISVAGALSCQQAHFKSPKKIEQREALLLEALYYLKTINWPKEALVKTFS